MKKVSVRYVIWDDRALKCRESLQSWAKHIGIKECKIYMRMSDRSAQEIEGLLSLSDKFPVDIYDIDHWLSSVKLDTLFSVMRNKNSVSYIINASVLIDLSTCSSSSPTLLLNAGFCCNKFPQQIADWAESDHSSILSTKVRGAKSMPGYNTGVICLPAEFISDSVKDNLKSVLKHFKLKYTDFSHKSITDYLRYSRLISVEYLPPCDYSCGKTFNAFTREV